MLTRRYCFKARRPVLNQRDRRRSSLLGDGIHQEALFFGILSMFRANDRQTLTHPYFVSNFRIR